MANGNSDSKKYRDGGLTLYTPSFSHSWTARILVSFVGCIACVPGRSGAPSEVERRPAHKVGTLQCVRTAHLPSVAGSSTAGKTPKTTKRNTGQHQGPSGESAISRQVWPGKVGCQWLHRPADCSFHFPEVSPVEWLSITGCTPLTGCLEA